jgi:large subunit ribosomal protein L15
MANEQVTLADLKPAAGATKNRKRVGRGPGSGNGTYAGRGNKGAQSRSGYKRRAWFEGGQSPLQRRMPERGFVHHKKVEDQIVNLRDINERTEGDRVDTAALLEAGLIRTEKRPVKVLADGELTRAVTIVADKFSSTAREKILSAGGSAEEPVRA